MNFMPEVVRNESASTSRQQGEGFMLARTTLAAVGALLSAPFALPALAEEPKQDSAQVVAAVQPSDRWQVRRLMQPTPAEIEREKKGEVFIYENLKDTEVKAALQQQFNRIQNMMFVGTVKTDEAGEVRRDPDTNAPVVEDNGGC
jgi:hypothetical protein